MGIIRGKIDAHWQNRQRIPKVLVSVREFARRCRTMEPGQGKLTPALIPAPRSQSEDEIYLCKILLAPDEFICVFLKFAPVWASPVIRCTYPTFRGKRHTGATLPSRGDENHESHESFTAPEFARFAMHSIPVPYTKHPPAFHACFRD